MRANKAVLAPLKIIFAAGLCVSALTACVTLSWTSARSPPSHTMSAPTKRG